MSNARDKANIPALNFSSTGIDDNATSTAITIDSSQNVGIGNTNPADFSGAGGQNLVVGSGSGAEGMTIYSGTTSDGVIGFADGSSGTADYRGFLIYKHNGDAFQFGTSSTERMRLTSTGLGIGTSSPSKKLDIVASEIGDIGINITNSLSSNGGHSASVNLISENANSDLSDATKGAIFVGGDLNNNNFQEFAIATESNTPIVFVTNGDGNRTNNNLTNERMRIDGSGNVLVGKTSSGVANVGAEFRNGSSNYALLGTSSSEATLILNRTTTIGDIAVFRYNNTTVGSISVTASATTYSTSSDYRLKENVSYDFDATTRLKQLKPARFNFIADANTTVDGFLAHEVSSVVPEAISGEKDAVDEDGNPKYQGIDQSKLVPLLVKTIQELEARITALETNNP